MCSTKKNNVPYPAASLYKHQDDNCPDPPEPALRGDLSEGLNPTKLLPFYYSLGHFTPLMCVGSSTCSISCNRERLSGGVKRDLETKVKRHIGSMSLLYLMVTRRQNFYRTLYVVALVISTQS